MAVGAEEYKEDILHNGFEQLTLHLADDYEGVVVATLVRRLSSRLNNEAILYIHGFNDYFFQTELAFRFNNKGYNFYALDLRKYGRSYLPHQKFNDIRDVKAYYEEIHKALNIIHREGNANVILFGHSTGGLIVSSFAKDYTGSKLFAGIILNSPFFQFNLNCFLKKLLPIFCLIGRKFPSFSIHPAFAHEYGKSLHNSSLGEWDYSLQWKPHVPPSISFGWINAICIAQDAIKMGFSVKEPLLVLHSAKSVTNHSDRNQLHTCDAILNVKDIDIISHRIKGDVTITPIENGLHDLILSRKIVRDLVYNSIFSWLDTKFDL